MLKCICFQFLHYQDAADSPWAPAHPHEENEMYSNFYEENKSIAQL